MSIQTILYLSILAASAVISLSLAFYVWQRRETTGAKHLALMMLVLFEWSLTYFLQILSPDLPTKIFWSRMAFLGIVTTPIVWFLFALEYTERRHWVKRSHLIGFFIIPVITTILIWTNASHHWFWTSVGLVQNGDLLLRVSKNGFWFWVHATYSYAFILAGTIMVVRALLNWPSQYRGQMFGILLGILAPWIANVLTIFDIVPFLIDITPFAFTLTGIGMAFSLFRHRLLDLAPIARKVIIEGMQDGMMVLDPSGRIVDTNQALHKIFGFSETQKIIGEKAVDAFNQWPTLVERYENVSTAADEIMFDIGTNQRWAELTISPLKDRGSFVGRLAIFRDITSRKKAEEQVRKLSRAVESSPTSIIITGLDGNIQYVNPKFTEVTGYTSDEVLGKNPNILKTDQTPNTTHNDLWEKISSGQNWSGEFCNRKKNGELYWEIASISPIHDDGGNITHYVAVKEDITKRKQTEKLLQENEERFRQIVENANDFIYRTDKYGNFTYANPAALRITGFNDEKEVLGRHYLELTTPAERHRMKRAYQKQFIRKIPNTYNEFPVATKDGRELWFGQNVQLLMEGDEVAGFQILARDITEIRRAQDALRIAYDQALEASRAKSQLLARVSHELRTPLGGIIGFSELLRDEVLGKIEEEQKNAAESILQSAQHLSTMVNELLDEAQMQNNTTTLKKTIFSPRTLLEQVASGMKIMAEKKDLAFVASLDPNLPEFLFSDEQRIRQILLNLIGNAIKFTQDGEVRVKLETPNPEQWTFEITDTGMGIPEDAQMSIFEPFKQADNAITSKNRGIGLGLSITKQLTGLMGGRILLESQIGKGSTFRVILPMQLPPLERKE